MMQEIPGLRSTRERFRATTVHLTCVHELGHVVGLEHTEDDCDIMNFFGYGGDIPAYFGRYRALLTSRDDIPKTSGLSTADAARVRKLCGHN